MRPATVTPSSRPLPNDSLPPARFSLNTPIATIAANKSGRMILDRDIPGLMSDHRYCLFDDMSLLQVASVSGGKLTTGKLAQVQADLFELNAQAP